MNDITISSATPRTKYLYHVTPASNSQSIARSGLLVSLSAVRSGAWRGVWLVTSSRLSWAITHVLFRWRCESVAVYRVAVRRRVLRRKWRGVWCCVVDVPASRCELLGVLSRQSRAGGR